MNFKKHIEIYDGGRIYRYMGGICNQSGIGYHNISKITKEDDDIAYHSEDIILYLNYKTEKDYMDIDKNKVITIWNSPKKDLLFAKLYPNILFIRMKKLEKLNEL